MNQTSRRICRKVIAEADTAIHQLCSSKDDGGLGFRDLSIFYQALLAKQVWRIHHNQHTLAANVLNHCYFADSLILIVVYGSSISFMCKSFVWDRELLEKGPRWRVAFVDSICIYLDSWIPRPSTFKIISPPVLSVEALVSELKLLTSSWNDNLVRNSFLPDDAKCILHIPCSFASHKDLLVWHFEKLGSFSIKSAYRQGCSLMAKSSNSGSGLSLGGNIFDA
ncbi:hypothetical protein Ddye_004659 [Dipteronia dyeriana]|uniref:Reverse transcriptase n=1 Tax=Dipteronia dyeriana TaxID=168575 RepID=A0AAE0CWJ0_9ROSI|nr:hypothetical protein Ddye_004659 [Dipteronia dyeriana]